MNKTKQKGIDTISIADKIDRITDLWDSIPDKETLLPVPPSHLAELKKRHAAIVKNPKKLLPLGEFIKRLARNTGVGFVSCVARS
ncbi:MAG: addiction module protein [Fibrobacterota bacterium]